LNLYNFPQEYANRYAYKTTCKAEFCNKPLPVKLKPAKPEKVIGVFSSFSSDISAK